MAVKRIRVTLSKENKNYIDKMISDNPEMSFNQAINTILRKGIRNEDTNK